MNIKGWLLIVGLLIMVLVSLPIWTANNASDTSNPVCKRSIVAYHLSPSRAFIAQQITESCEDKELGSMIVHRVTIINLQTHKTYDVLAIDRDEHEEDRTAVNWVTSNILEVILSNRSAIKVFTQDVTGVHIKLTRRAQPAE